MVNVAADDAGRVLFLDGQAGKLAQLRARLAMVGFVLTGGLGLPETADGLDPEQPAAGAAHLAGSQPPAPATSGQPDQGLGEGGPAAQLLPYAEVQFGSGEKIITPGHERALGPFADYVVRAARPPSL